MINPYNQKVVDVSLKTQDIQAFVFWSRNYQPFIEKKILQGLKHPFVCHLTITMYPRKLDRATISPEKAIWQAHYLKNLFGQRVVVWRYDPIVFSPELSADWHVENFEKIASQLSGAVDEVSVSFAQFYQKTKRNFAKSGFDALDPSQHEKQQLLLKLHHIAKKHRIKLSLCAQPDLLIQPVEPGACIDVKRLSECAGHDLYVNKRSHRKECGCASSKDIGEYNTCPHGCLYCYAVENRELAKERFHKHDPHSPFLFEPENKISEQKPQETLL